MISLRPALALQPYVQQLWYAASAPSLHALREHVLPTGQRQAGFFILQESTMIHELFAYLCVSDAGKAIAFYQAAFGATEKFRLTEPSGRIGHAELDFGPVTLMLSDEFPECGIRSPLALGGSAVSIHLHVDNADAVIGRAVEAGATLERPPQDEFYGERGGVVRDPFGHRWNIGHSIETLTPAEMQRRYDALLAGG